jgi:hypothetical protein
MNLFEAIDLLSEVSGWTRNRIVDATWADTVFLEQAVSTKGVDAILAYFIFEDWMRRRLGPNLPVVRSSAPGPLGIW